MICDGREDLPRLLGSHYRLASGSRRLSVGLYLTSVYIDFISFFSPKGSQTTDQLMLSDT